MKAAFAAWEDRVAPVFDVARRVRVIETRGRGIVAQEEATLAEDVPARRALLLAELGVDTLVCGAISKPLQAMVAAHGIRVIPFVAGDLGEVVQAWLGGHLLGGAYDMPGCCGAARRRRRGTGPAAGPGGECICPQCGHREPHERRQRCAQRSCPRCGSAMARR